MKKFGFKQKLALILISLAALVTVVLIPEKAMAADAAVFEVKVSSTEGKEGDDLTVTLSLKENPGLAGVQLELHYDTDVLTVKEVFDEDSEEMVSDAKVMGVFTGAELKVREDLGFVGCAFAQSTNTKKTGDVIEINFKIKENAKVGDSKLELIIGGVVNKDEEDLEFSKTDGKINVVCEHVETEEKVTAESTCTEAGKKAVVCKKCGKEISVSEIPLKEHAYGEYAVTKQATCTEAGEETAKCANCTVEQKREIAALGHKFGEFTETKAPTCTEAGEKTAKCERCDEAKKESVAALGHKFGKFTETKAPTCTEAGEKTAKCERCDEAKKESVAALGHKFGEFTETKAPTCKEAGEKTAKCERCDEAKKESVAALGHKFGEFIETKAPTCTEAGEKTAKCERCDEAKKESVEALGHDMKDAVITKAPTCTEAGEKTATCSRCGNNVKETIPALGHTYTEYKVTKEATETEDGEMVRICTVCGDEVKEVIPSLGKVKEEVLVKDDKNQDLKEEYSTGKTIVFVVMGIGMDNMKPKAGDIRFIPVKWSIEKADSVARLAAANGTWKEGDKYMASYTAEEAGDYTLKVDLQKQVYTEGAWKSEDTVISKEVGFSVAEEPEKPSEGTENPSEKPSEGTGNPGDETIDKPAQTGDSVNVAVIIMMLAAAGVATVIFTLKKKMA